MKLRKNILKKLDVQNNRLLLALALGVSEQAIIRYIRKNSDDLTKAASLKVIREITGLSDEDILLEESAEVQR